MIHSRNLPFLTTLTIFVVAYLLCVMQYPAIFSTRVIGNLLTDNAFLGIAAVGMTFVITTGGIDLSISATMTIGAVGFGLAFQAGLPFWPAAVVGVLSATVIGIANGLLIAKGKVTDFIATLGTLGVATMCVGLGQGITTVFERV